MADNRKWFDWHSGLGVLSGLLLFIICWSGTTATLSHEVDWLLNPDLRVEPHYEPVDFEATYDAVRAAWPEASVNTIDVPLYANAAISVRVRTQNEQTRWVYVDPNTYTVTGSSSYFNVQRFFRSFHMNLFNPFHFLHESGFGYFIVGFFGLVVLASMLTSLVFYKRWWSRILAVKFSTRNARTFWSSVHRQIGLWSLWFVLAIGVTGTWYLFEHSRIRLGDGKVTFVDAGTEPSPYALNTIIVPPASDPANSLSTIVERAQSVRPDLSIRSIGLNSESGLVYVTGQANHILVRDRANKVYIDSSDGKAVLNQSASDLPVYWRWSDTADPLHFGDFGGLWTKLIWFVFGLFLTGLVLTGTYLHIKRLARDRANGTAGRKGTEVAVAFTCAVLLGSIWAGFKEVRAYGPIVDGVRHWPQVSTEVTAFLICWLLLTLAVVVSLTWMLASQKHTSRRDSAKPTALRRLSNPG